MKKCKTIRGRVLELPLPLIYDILSRLTVETVFRCKCVCKTFLHILTNPYFVELHLTRKKTNRDYGVVIQERRHISNILLVYNNRLDIENPDLAYSQTITMPSAASQVYKNTAFIVGSCNGLLCLRYGDSKTCNSIYYICNPVLGEFFTLPPHVQYRTVDITGFGFCSNTNQYKVLRFVTPSNCTIYTLGTCCWRTLENIPFPKSLSSRGCSLNGNLHWIAKGEPVSNLICSFNLETEQVSYMSTPACFKQEYLDSSVPINIALLDGLLCFSYLVGHRFEAFVKKDYGVEGCWSKEFSVDLSSDFIRREKGYRLVSLLNSGDLIIQCDVYDLVCCDLRKETTRNMLAKKVLSCCILSFVPSFISLKDLAAAAGRSIEVVQRKIGRKHRSDRGFLFISQYTQT